MSFGRSAADFDSIEERLKRNVARAGNLGGVCRALKGVRKRGRSRVGLADVLRSAVVFLHATLEEFLRGIGGITLKEADAHVLDGVPIVGSRASRSPEKFFLGRLAEHRGKTVDSLLAESIEQWLSRLTFNNASEVVGFLRRCGIEYQDSEGHLAVLDKMMDRRHKIVHEADRHDRQGRGHHKVRSLSAETVNKWAYALIGFSATVLMAVDSDDA